MNSVLFRTRPQPPEHGLQSAGTPICLPVLSPALPSIAFPAPSIPPSLHYSTTPLSGTPWDALGRHLGRFEVQKTQCLRALGRWDGLERGWGGCQVSSLRRTAEKRDSVIQSEAELNRQLSQIITCLSEAISIYVKLCKAISSQLFFPQRLPSENRTQPSPSEPFRTVPKFAFYFGDEIRQEVPHEKN